jgi:hypothetical protein
MAWGLRKSTRVSFDHGIDVLIMGIDGTWRRQCKLFDVSVSGARLIVADSLEGLNLEEFFLMLTPTGAAFRRCELIRLNGDEIGVRFLKRSEVRSKPKRRPGSPSAIGG